MVVVVESSVGDADVVQMAVRELPQGSQSPNLAAVVL
jgi:hypothetical protein